MEHLPVDTATGKVKGTSSNAGSLPKPFDFSDVEVFGTIPRGGGAGQALVKQSGDDFDTLWTDFVTGESGIEPLVIGQNYIDVAFTAEKPSADWSLNECHIVNEIDASPLNLAPGIITSKTTLGFRLQLNGAPNSGNYELHWAIGLIGAGGTGVSDFLALTDTPDSYTGAIGKVVRVNATEDGLEFGLAPSVGPAFVNVLDYGAKADCVTLFDISMGTTSNVITSTAYTFTAEDVGKIAIIRGAKDSSGQTPMIATITSVSGHSATLDKATTLGLTNIQPTSFPRMDFGTDNTIAFVLACLAIPGPGNRNHFLGTPFPPAGTMNPILPGDGGTVYIPVGHYLLNETNAFPFWFFEANCIHIKGGGMGATVLFCHSILTASGVYGGGFNDDGLFQNVTLSDFTMWDLNYFYSGITNTINMWRIDNLRIERVECVNGKGNGCIKVQGYPNVTNRIYIRDCWVHGYVADGDSTGMHAGIEGDGMNVGDVREVHIENNLIEGTERHGYEGGGNCYDQYFIGNTVDMKSGGLSAINPTGGNTTLVIGNTCKNCQNWFGIDFSNDVGAFNAKDIRVLGNYISGTTLGPQSLMRFQNSSGDESTPGHPQHIDRIIVANNWLYGPYAYTAGIFWGGEACLAMLVEGNWFNVGYYGIQGEQFQTVPGQYCIVKNNYFSCPPMQQLGGNIIIEGNVVPSGLSGYSGSDYGCNIDGQTIAAGAIYSNVAFGTGWRLTDSVEIVRGPTADSHLIIWGVVTAYNPTTQDSTVTTFAFNPTGSSVGTGTGTRFIVHRPILPS
jgi:hypothetical protein